LGRVFGPECRSGQTILRRRQGRRFAKIPKVGGGEGGHRGSCTGGSRACRACRRPASEGSRGLSPDAELHPRRYAHRLGSARARRAGAHWERARGRFDGRSFPRRGPACGRLLRDRGCEGCCRASAPRTAEPRVTKPGAEQTRQGREPILPRSECDPWPSSASGRDRLPISSVFPSPTGEAGRRWRPVRRASGGATGRAPGRPAAPGRRSGRGAGRSRGCPPRRTSGGPGDSGPP